jgi:hypothetical protein
VLFTRSHVLAGEIMVLPLTIRSGISGINFSNESFPKDLRTVLSAAIVLDALFAIL